LVPARPVDGFALPFPTTIANPRSKALMPPPALTLRASHSGFGYEQGRRSPDPEAEGRKLVVAL